jgi:F5/8 type C domain
MRLWALALLSLLLQLALAGPAAAQDARLLDDFSAPSRWRSGASDGVTASAAPFEGGLRLDYDFSRGSGYAFLHRDLPLELPANFELRFRLRGAGAANALEVKLIDASGSNVWWHRRADYVPPGGWTTLRIRRRQIDFAWGPTQDRGLHRAAAIELVVAAGSGGGRGWIVVDDLQIVPLPVPPVLPPPIVATADGGEGAALAVDGDRATAWTVAAAGAALRLDLGYRREFGGLVLRWVRRPFLPATAYEISLSDDGRTWRQALTIRDGDGMSDWLQMPDSEAHYIRIRINRVLEDSAALAEVEVRPLAFGANANALVAALAAEEPRGFFPRGFTGEQNYWTLVATPDGGRSGLIDEDGAIEVGRGGFSIEPMVAEGDRRWRWSDITSVQSLRDGDLPIPTVEWRGPGWRLTITAIAERHRIVARYRLRNDGADARTLRLALNLRPFQVNPPQQFLNITGGVSPIRSLGWDGRAISVNGVPRVWLDQGWPEIRLYRFDSGPVEGGGGVVGDESGLASGWLGYSLTLQPGEEREIALSLGLDEGAGPIGRDGAAAVEDAAAARWRTALGDVRITGPAAARPALDTLRTALAHILATREGPALRPGSRSYARAWIRDGAMMSTALLRMGLDRPAIDFLEYYAPFQYPDGKVPCCVDARGADPVAENDSDGELIHLVAQLQRYAPDAARLRRMWPHVAAAAGHIERLRQSARVPANRAGPTRAFFGLLPPSISHEGYSAQPMHSYWDDFWGLTGLKDAAWLAGELGEAGEARRLAAAADEFRADILASLAAAREIHRIAFIPGAADLGDFDPTSTTIALSPAGEQARLPRDALTATFERYWSEFVARRDGRRAWDAYTPYEWRNVGAFVRLGWRDRATALADFFMADRRPAGWNQ